MIAPSLPSFVKRNPGVALATTALVAMLLAGLFAPLPYNPVRPDAETVLRPPSPAHWFGTDRSGFDVLSRTIASAGRDLPLALAGTIASVLVGVPLGLLASARGKWGERMMRVLPGCCCC